MDWERTGGTVYTVKTEKRISFNSCINNIVKLNTYCHICLVSLVKRSLKRHWRILVFFLSFFFIKGEWTGGWGWGKTYSTFKLFTHGDSGVTACLSLWDWKGVVGLKMEGEAALPLWNEPSKCNQQIVLLAIWQAWALGRMFLFFFCYSIFLCLCWGENFKLEQCSSLLAASEELFMWLRRYKEKEKQGLLFLPAAEHKTFSRPNTDTDTQLLVLCCSHSVCHVQTILINELSFFKECVLSVSRREILTYYVLSTHQ